MKTMIKKITLFLSIALFLIVPHGVVATENPFTITFLKGSGGKATISVISSRANIIGSISLVKDGASIPIKNCVAAFNSSGQANPCQVTGLMQGQGYSVVVSASDAAGNSYKGVEQFTYTASSVLTPSTTASSGSFYTVKTTKLTSDFLDITVLYTGSKKTTTQRTFSCKKQGKFDPATYIAEPGGGTLFVYGPLVPLDSCVLTIESTERSSLAEGSRYYTTIPIAVPAAAAIVAAPAPSTPMSPITTDTVYTPTPVEHTEAGGLVPCTDGCGFTDVLILFNNIISFLIAQLFIPAVILLFIYTGFSYITSKGNASKIINVKKLVLHIVVGMVLILCSWLIVKTVLNILLQDPSGSLLQ